MQWLIDIVKEWIVAQGYLTHSYVDRGDPATDDYNLTDLTLDESWHDLDLSAIVPQHAKAVHLYVALAAGQRGKYLWVRKKGNINIINRGAISIVALGFYHTIDLVCTLDTNRVIEYYGSSTDIDFLKINIRGWWF